MNTEINTVASFRKSWELLADFGFTIAQCHLWADSVAHLCAKQQEAIVSRVYGIAINVENLAQCERELASRFASASRPGDVVRNIESIRHATNRVADAFASFRTQRDALLAVLRFANVKVEAEHFGGTLAGYIDMN